MGGDEDMMLCGVIVLYLLDAMLDFGIACEKARDGHDKWKYTKR